MEKNKVAIVESPDGDWMALYFNGELLFQDHSITLSQGMAILQSRMEFLYSRSPMTQKMLKDGRCPDKI
jgi:hypothetical protein